MEPGESVAFHLQDFTPEEQKCISGQIRKRRKEGTPQKEAIAESIGVCAPGKRRKTSALKSSLPGGEYAAFQMEDGKWWIPDVPIMGEVPRLEKMNRKHIGQEWQEQAAERSMARLNEDKFTAPIHLHHHMGPFGKPTERAGSFWITDVREMKLEGEDESTIFADFLLEDQAYQKVRAGKFPHLSVEVFDWDEPEVNSLALMDDEVPFCRFPNLTIGTETVPLAKEPVKFSEKGSAVMMRAAGPGGIILFNWRSQMPKKAKKLDGNPPDPAAEEAARLQKEEEERKKKEEEGKMADNGMMARVLAALEAIAAAVGAELPAAEEVDETDDGGAPPTAPAEMGEQLKKKKKKKGDVTYAGASPEMQKLIAQHAETAGKLAAMQNDLKQRDDKEKLLVQADKEWEKLKARGLGEAVHAQLREIAEKDGEVGLKSFVKGLGAAPTPPPESFDGDLSLGGGSPDSEAVLDYAKNPAEMERARYYSYMHAQLKAAGRTKATEADFIKSNITQEKRNKLVREGARNNQ